MEKISLYFSNDRVAYTLAQDVEHCLKRAVITNERDYIVERLPMDMFHPSALLKSKAIIMLVATQFHGQSLPEDASVLDHLERVPVADHWCRFAAFGIDHGSNDHPFKSFKRLINIARGKGWMTLCTPSVGDVQDTYTLLCQLDDWIHNELLPGLGFNSSEDEAERDSDEDDTPLYSEKDPVMLSAPSQLHFSQEGDIMSCQDPLSKCLRKLARHRAYARFKVIHNTGGLLRLRLEAGRLDSLTTLLDIWPGTPADLVEQLYDGLNDPSIPNLVIDRVLTTDRSWLLGLSADFVLRHLLDLQASPSRALLNRISDLFEDKFRAKLRELSSFTQAGIMAYCDYVTDYRRSLVEIILDFLPGFRADAQRALIQHLVAYVPFKHPRSYFVASHPLWSTFVMTQRKLRQRLPCVSNEVIMEFTTRLISDRSRRYVDTCVDICYDRIVWSTKSRQRQVEGACSSYLASLKPGDIIYASVVSQKQILSRDRQNLLMCYDNGYYFARAAAFQAIVSNSNAIICAAPSPQVSRSQLVALSFLSNLYPQNVICFIPDATTSLPANDLERMLENRHDAIFNKDTFSQISGTKLPVHIIISAVGFPNAGRPSRLVEAIEDVLEDKSMYRISYLKRL